jgi:hypothetical protein
MDTEGQQVENIIVSFQSGFIKGVRVMVFSTTFKNISVIGLFWFMVLNATFNNISVIS